METIIYFGIHIIGAVLNHFIVVQNSRMIMLLLGLD